MLEQEMLTAIREHCRSCCGGNGPEINRCELLDCDLWPWRMGRSGLRVVGSGTKKERIYVYLKKKFPEQIMSAAVAGVDAGIMGLGEGFRRKVPVK